VGAAHARSIALRADGRAPWSYTGSYRVVAARTMPARADHSASMRRVVVRYPSSNDSRVHCGQRCMTFPGRLDPARMSALRLGCCQCGTTRCSRSSARMTTGGIRKCPEPRSGSSRADLAIAASLGAAQQCGTQTPGLSFGLSCHRSPLSAQTYGRRCPPRHPSKDD
jgi:hypothetical protein